MQLHYTVSLPRPETHLFHVSIEHRTWMKRAAKLILPAWIPGSYLIREFARHVEGFHVESPDGQPLPWHRSDKGTWQVGNTGRGFRVRYRVYANELSVRTSHLDSSHGYFNGANLFMYIEGAKEGPATLEIDPPTGWNVSVALPRDASGHYRVKSYDQLADTPAEIGTHRVLRFEVLGKPHEIALWGRGNEDEQALIRDFKQIVETVARFFDGDLPYERYLFIIHLDERGSGGLEHRDSTTLHVDRWSFQPRSAYENFLRFATHEFFHTWNVKRIRPVWRDARGNYLQPPLYDVKELSSPPPRRILMAPWRRSG